MNSRQSTRQVADQIRARLDRGEKLTAEDGLVLTLLDALADRDEPRRPITGGLRMQECPDCGRSCEPRAS